MKKSLMFLIMLLGLLAGLHADSKSIDKSHSNVQRITKPAKEVKSTKAVIFEDGFETYTDFATTFAPWVMLDVDGGVSYSITDVTFPNQAYTGSFIIWNPALTTPAQTGAWLPHTGAKSATCFNAVTASAPNNDWLISPPITLQTASQLKFWAESVTDLYGLEKFKVGISAGGTAATDFTIISGATAIEAPTTWTEFTYDLAAYDGQSIRIAIQCVSNDAFAMQIDDFSVLGVPGGGADVTAPTVVSLAGNSVLPNTAMNLTLLVSDASGVPATITAVYNVGAGDQTITMTKSTKAQYTYTGTIPARPAVEGTIKFNLADVTVPPNTVTTPTYPIKWTEPPVPGVFGLGEGFEGTFVPEGWANVNVDGAGTTWASATGVAHGGTKYAWHNYASASAGNQNGMLILPQFKVAVDGKLKFWQKQGFTSYYFYHGIYVSTTDASPASFTELIKVPVCTATWAEKTIDLSAYTGQTVYLAFVYQGTDADSWWIDDVHADKDDGAVVPPNDLGVTTLTTTPASVYAGELVTINTTVKNNGTDDQYDVQVVFKIDGTVVSTQYIDILSAGATNNLSYNWTATAGSHTIRVEVPTDDNVANDFKTMDITVSTPVSVFPYTESFDGTTFPPNGWTSAQATGTGLWERVTVGVNPTVATPHSGLGMAQYKCFSYTAQTSAIIATPKLILTESAYKVKFWMYRDDNTSYPTLADRVKVYVNNTTDSTGATLLGTVNRSTILEPVVASAGWYEYSFTFTNTKDKANKHIILKGVSAYGNNIFVDDVTISVSGPDVLPPVCATPFGTTNYVNSPLTVSTVVTDDDSDIANVVGHYQLTGQTTWSDFVMTASKVSGTYTGTIPAQDVAIGGKVKFTATDTAPIANSADSPEFDICWAPTPSTWIQWGSTYQIGTGIGLAAAPWWAAVDYDFGTKADPALFLTRAEISLSSASGIINVPFKTLRVNQPTPGTLIVAEDLGVSGVMLANGTTQAVSTLSFNKQIGINGHFAIAFSLPSGYVNRDTTLATSSSAHTWIFVGGTSPDTLVLLNSVNPAFTGAWWIRVGAIAGSGVEELELLPGKSTLSQNYPNPFNPSTAINFFNNMTGEVKLTVLNAKGEHVTTLVNNKMRAGNHSVNFDGSRFNSGVYFYKLETPTAKITKKMLLVK